MDIHLYKKLSAGSLTPNPGHRKQSYKSSVAITDPVPPNQRNERWLTLSRDTGKRSCRTRPATASASNQHTPDSGNGSWGLCPQLSVSGHYQQENSALERIRGRSYPAKDGEAPPKPKSRKTVKLYRDNLETMLKHAQHWGWLGNSNPMDGVTRITKANQERVRFLDDDERKALLTACRDSPNQQLFPIVIFALCTGARLNEILKLTLKDLDLQRQVAILRETKNKETRKAPIVNYLKNVLEAHLEWREEFVKEMPDGSRFLFPRKDGRAPIDIRKAWENARDKAGIIDFRFHDLRHSAASYLAMNGASQLEIAEVLGHKTLQMVKRYSHLSEDHTRQVVEKMAGKIFEPTE